MDSIEKLNEEVCKKQTTIISAMLNNGLSQEEIFKITNIPIKEVKTVKF